MHDSQKFGLVRRTIENIYSGNPGKQNVKIAISGGILIESKDGFFKISTVNLVFNLGQIAVSISRSDYGGLSRTAIENYRKIIEESLDAVMKLCVST